MKYFPYQIMAPLLFWILIAGGTYVVDQKKIDSCLDAGKAFNYQSFTCVAREPAENISYYKARYTRFAGLSVAVLIYVGAVTVFSVMRELNKHNKL